MFWLNSDGWQIGFTAVPPNAPRFSTTRFSHVGLALPVVCAKPSRSGSEGHFPTFGVGFKIARPVSWSAIRRFIQLSKIEAPKGLVWDGRRTRFPLALAATCPLTNSAQNRDLLQSPPSAAATIRQSRPMFIGLKKIFHFFQGVEKRGLRKPRLAPAAAFEVCVCHLRVLVAVRPVSPPEVPSDALHRAFDKPLPVEVAAVPRPQAEVARSADRRS